MQPALTGDAPPTILWIADAGNIEFGGEQLRLGRRGCEEANLRLPARLVPLLANRWAAAQFVGMTACLGGLALLRREEATTAVRGRW